MSGTTVRVGPKGRIVIPIELRERYGIEEGDELRVIPERGGLRLVDGRTLVEELRGSLAGGRSLSEELIEERRAEAASELDG
jgi:AbrB family looped-hinge helix DNA binding protein